MSRVLVESPLDVCEGRMERKGDLPKDGNGDGWKELHGCGW
jgi:hypothetical protein